MQCEQTRIAAAWWLCRYNQINQSGERLRRLDTCQHEVRESHEVLRFIMLSTLKINIYLFFISNFLKFLLLLPQQPEAPLKRQLWALHWELWEAAYWEPQRTQWTRSWL